MASDSASASLIKFSPLQPKHLRSSEQLTKKRSKCLNIILIHNSKEIIDTFFTNNILAS